MHGPLAQRHPLLIAFLAELDEWVYTLPGHTLRPLQHRLDIHQLRPIPVQFQDAPTPLDGIILTMVRWVVQQMNRLTNAIAKRHHPLQKLRPLPTALRTVVHFDLQLRHGDLLGLVQRGPPGLKRIDDEITRLERAPKGDAQLRTVFLHDATGNIFLVHTQVVITRPVIAPREAAAGDIPDRHGGFTIDTQAFDVWRGRCLLVLFSILAQMASVSASFFCGVALTTLRSRKPRRLSPSAIVL